jgi:hypothetical protein
MNDQGKNKGAQADTIGNQASSPGKSSSPNKSTVPDHYTFTLDSEDNSFKEYLSFTEAKNTIDLIDLYIDVNQRVVEQKKTTRRFQQFTSNLSLIRQ